MARAKAEPVYSISAAPTAQSVDLEQRMRRYLVPMVIRASVIPIVVFVDHPIRWFLAGFAIVAPYVAVIIANNSRVGRRPVVAGVSTEHRAFHAPAAIEDVNVCESEPVFRDSASRNSE